MNSEPYQHSRVLLKEHSLEYEGPIRTVRWVGPASPLGGMEDTAASKAAAGRCTGSSPVVGTNRPYEYERRSEGEVLSSNVITSLRLPHNFTV